MKKIRITRVLALVMMLAVILGSFAGCGKGGSQKTDQERIVGKWVATIDFEKVIKESIGSTEGGEVFEDVDFSGISMKMNAEFQADGTYAVTLDKDSAEGAIREMANRMVPALKEMIRESLAEGMGVDVSEVTDDQLDAMLPYLGVESWDDLADLMMASVSVDDLTSSGNFSGKYMVKDGKFYSAGSGEVTEQSESMRYEFKDDNTLVLHVEDASEDVPEFMHALTFKRVG